MRSFTVETCSGPWRVVFRDNGATELWDNEEAGRGTYINRANLASFLAITLAHNSALTDQLDKLRYGNCPRVT